MSDTETDKALETSSPVCNMVNGCPEPITHLDTAGFVYCSGHGLKRRAFEPCRKLRAWEVRRLQQGLTLGRY